MLGYSGGRIDLPMERIKLAEQLGYHSVWTAEAYGSDAMTPLAYIAAHTDRIKLGTGIIQLAGRAPAMAAMQAQTAGCGPTGGAECCGARRLGSSDSGRLVWATLGQAVLAFTRLHPDHEKDF